MRCELIAELATNHGGDLDLALEMMTAAADAGADWAKTQAYQVKHLKPSDPQYAWLKQCELSDKAHKVLMAHAATCGVRYLSTAFCLADAKRLERLGVKSVKVGSGESLSGMVGHYAYLAATFSPVFASVAWGTADSDRVDFDATKLATVPLYPMPTECYSRVKQRAGWSDHAVGIDVAKLAIADGARVVEKHFGFRDRGRWQEWNMDSDMLRELRRWAEVCAVARDGSAYEGRWQQTT